MYRYVVRTFFDITQKNLNGWTRVENWAVVPNDFENTDDNTNTAGWQAGKMVDKLASRKLVVVNPPPLMK